MLLRENKLQGYLSGTRVQLLNMLPLPSSLRLILLGFSRTGKSEYQALLRAWALCCNFTNVHIYEVAPLF